MLKYGGFNAPPPPQMDNNDSDDEGLEREQRQDSLSDESQSNSVEPHVLSALGASAMSLNLLRDNAVDSSGGGDDRIGSAPGPSRRSVLPKPKAVSFGGTERQQFVARQPTFLKNEDSVSVDVPGELPTFNKPPSLPKPPIGKNFGNQNLSQSLIMCMDPTCTSCPPEFHAMRRRKADAPKRPEGGLPPRTSDGSKTLKDELATLSDSDDDEEDTLLSYFRKRLKMLRPKILFRKCRDGWSTFLGLMRWNEVLNPNSTFVRNWNLFFVWAMFAAFTIDPLFFFVTAVNNESYCLYTNWKYVHILSVLRTFTDFIYFLHMLMQFRVAYKEPPAPTTHFYWFGKRKTLGSPGEWVFDRNLIAYNYFRSWFILDVFGLLPVPQIMAMGVIPSFFPGPASIGANLLRVSVLLQYFPRTQRCYQLMSGSQATGLLFESAWASFILNLIMYIVCSHVVGSMWYLAALQRWDQCAFDSCAAQRASGGQCNDSYLNCPYGVDTTAPGYMAGQGAWVASGTIVTNCKATFSAPSEFFDYGIFAVAVPLLFDTTAFNKYIYALQWGFTQISTLGGNQLPSKFVPEVLFVILITGGGLLLFAVLIGNIQTFLQSLTRRSFEYQLHRRDVENWMTRRNLPRVLASRVRDLERLQWAANQGVDEKEVLGSLTDDLQRDVRRHLCLDLIKKSKLFSAMDDAVLDFICERLVQHIFIDGTVVIRERFPVKRLFFVLRGELESTTTGGGRTGFFNRVMLGNGDFFGEELLVAYLESTEDNLKKHRGNGRAMRRAETFARATSGSSSSSGGSLLDVFPRSERTIKCVGPVEGFALEAEDLEFMCRQFSDILHQPSVQIALNQCSQNRRTRAAMTIQLKYRWYLRRKLNIKLAHFWLAKNEHRLGNLVKWVVDNPGRQPVAVLLNPGYAMHRPPGLQDFGPRHS